MPLTGATYRIGGHIANGAFSFVFECVDEWTHSLVAKVARPLEDTSQTESKVTTEVIASAIVRSPHIVHVHDTFFFKGAYYIISERCAFTLRDMFEDEPNIRWTWLPVLMKAILHGLHFVHVQGIAHCDVHAGNVFLHHLPDSLLPEQQGAFNFKLGDFGQARPISEMDPTGTFHRYLRPPEALSPDEYGPLDHRGDIYQAGLLFLTFIRGEEREFTEQEVLSGVPRKEAESLPTAFAEVIAKMLRRHSETRQFTALEVWREIVQAQSS